MTTPATEIIVTTLYKFAPFPNVSALKPPLLEACVDAGLTGTLILAEEGINGTIAGSRQGIDAVLDRIRLLSGCRDWKHQESIAEDHPFLRMKVRLKKEIVTMGVPGIDPATDAGIYVEPVDWNDLMADPDVVVIDTRNDYEVGIGSFRGAIDPKTKSFSEFPHWFRSNRSEFARSKFAMFCTGGIRCEKATAFLKQEGIEQVYHLRGGILNYLGSIPERDTLWEGECFVFDRRVSVGHGLTRGTHELCYACRRPIDASGKASNKYSPGVSCANCYDQLSEDRKQGFQERQRQIERSRRRGGCHLGAHYRLTTSGDKAKSK